MKEASRLAAALSGLPLLLLAGCGMVSAPQPPSLKLPDPVTDLTAQRTGDHVDLHWTMPKRATDKVLLVGDQKVQVCRQLESEPCITAGNVLFAPLASAIFTDQLPSALASGPPRPLTYTVLLQNHAGRSAGPSNLAVTVAGSAPLPIDNLQAHAQANGIDLTWTPTGRDETVRIVRKLADAGKPAEEPSQNSAIPPEQTLEYSGPDKGQLLDRDAALDHTYTYAAQRIVKLTIAGQPIELAGESSPPITINARDVFPPAIPAGLQAVADAEARAIDLSWQPDTESDLAGYAVYRHEAGTSAPPVRISSTQPGASFHDTNVVPGHTYEYSVSAIDRDGNESKPSAPVEETIPTQQ